jgi:hypothetical protein
LRSAVGAPRLAAAATTLEQTEVTMPYKRRVSKGPGTKITPETLELYRRGLQLHRRQDRSVEDQRAYSRACSELDLALGLKPWMESPLDTVGLDAPPDWMTGELEVSDWHQSAGIRRQLEAALAAQRKARRRTPPPSQEQPAA